MKKSNILICTISILMILTIATGCDSKKDSGGSTGKSIYYVDSEKAKLVTKEYDDKNKTGADLIEDVLRQLTVDNDGYLSAIPNNVKINSYNLADSIAVVDFSSDYAEMKAERELLCRAAVVLTLTQNENIDFVAFTINKVPLKEKDGKVVGAMKAGDFVSDLGGGNNMNATTNFTLYFANEDGSKLKEYKLVDAKYGEMSKERFIIDQLIKGPKEKGYTATLLPEIKLLSIVTANNICYVDFQENFLEEQSYVPNKIVIYSIVNSLSELNEIHKVQISINGDSMVKYHNEISLSQPFIRNLDLIETNQTEYRIEETNINFKIQY